MPSRILSMKNAGKVLLLLCILLLASCGTKKRAIDAVGSTKADVTSLHDIVQTVNANRSAETFVTAKANLSFLSSDRNVSLGGTLRMKRDDVIQLSLVTFGILEVARIEITPDCFMVIDKVNRQYLKIAFRDVPVLGTVGIGFHTFQALFWDELFLLSDAKAMPDEKRFTKTTEGNKARLTNKDNHLAVLTFLVETLSGVIRQTSVAPHRDGASPYLTWDYADFGQFGGKNFPTKHIITMASGSKSTKVELSLSNLKNESGWETRTDISDRSYKQMDVEKVFSRILPKKKD